MTAANIGFTNMVRTEWIETETTQERVLEALKSHGEEIARIRGSTDDRWRSTEEMAYQAGQRQIMEDHKAFQFERDRIQDLEINAMVVAIEQLLRYIKLDYLT